MLSQWLLPALWLVNCYSGLSSMTQEQYRFSVFSLEDTRLDPIPRTNKFVITKENITLLAQLTPTKTQDAAASSRHTERFFWAGAAPHMTLSNVNRTIEVPFAMELFRREGLVAWRCQLQRSRLAEDLSDIGGGQWTGEVGLSRGSGFLATRVSLTDVRIVSWPSWPWPHPLPPAATVAPRTGRLRYLPDPCGGDLGMLAALPPAGGRGLMVATVLGNRVTWYDLGKMEMVRAAFGGSIPASLSLLSAVMTSAHLFLLTTHGLLLSPAFRGPQGADTGAFTLLQLQTRNATPVEEQVNDELVHSLSCNKEDNETVLLLYHSERRYFLGRPPFPRRGSWRDLKTLLPWPGALDAVRDVRYVWHWDAVFLGYDKGDVYETQVMRLGEARGGDRPVCDGHCDSQPVTRPYVLLCPLTKRVYLLAEKLFVSTSAGGSFTPLLPDLSPGRVEHCATDLAGRHLCLTEHSRLIVIGVGSDEPEVIPLKDLSPGLNITEAAKTALMSDPAGGVTMYGAGAAGFSSHYLNIETGLPGKQSPCDHHLELLGGVRHNSMIRLDVHDVATVTVEARRTHGAGDLSTSPDLPSEAIALELSNPAILHVRRAASVGGAAVSVTVRPNAWAPGAVCAITFRLPSLSALCTRTSRVITVALSPSHSSVAVDMPRGRDPRSGRDVRRHVEKGDGAFYELPVNYRPPSDLGINIPTSDNIYNADPSQPLNKDLLIEHAVSRSTGRFKACRGKADRSQCGCSEAERYSMHVKDSDCRVHVPLMSWPAKLRLTMSLRGGRQPPRPLLPPAYVTVTELNNRSSWENHVLLDPDLGLIYQRNRSARDRRLVDPQRIRILMKGTGLYHFRLRVAEHTSFRADHDDILVFVVPARLKSQVQHVVYPLVGVSLIITLFVVFEYYHRRYAERDEEDSESEEEEDPADAAIPRGMSVLGRSRR